MSGDAFVRRAEIFVMRAENAKTGPKFHLGSFNLWSNGEIQAQNFHIQWIEVSGASQAGIAILVN